MSHILTAARAEFRKLDRPIYEGDFRWGMEAVIEDRNVIANR